MIVIPMAGISSRFFNAGFTQPKYMLEAQGDTLFAHAVKSFAHYFEQEPFLFIIRDVFGTKAFIEKEVDRLGIKQAHIVTLEDETRGQAETVYLGLQALAAEDGPITIFNIDTFRPGFTFPENIAQWDGYLEVFEGSGDNWSFARPEHSNSTKVVETAEKNPISNLCSTGLYYFARTSDFLDAYRQELARPVDTWAKGELYIAPLYNQLIADKLNIHYHLIDRQDVIFCGVPDEYYHFAKGTK